MGTIFRADYWVTSNTGHRFILRALTSLGYQSQYTVLQAAEHNTPQSRMRVIFWASQAGYPLPAFPQPSNVVSSRISPKSWHKTRRSAPHAIINVGAALTDLPAYEWINPHAIIPQTAQERLEREQRSTTIPQYEVERKSDFVGENLRSYPSVPRSEFQRKMRARVPIDRLMNHVTMSWYDTTIERVCSIPLIPDSDHRVMPKKLRLEGLNNETARKHNFYPGRFGRLDYEGIFNTCMTDIAPGGKNGKVSICLEAIIFFIFKLIPLRYSIRLNIELCLCESTLELWACQMTLSSTSRIRSQR